MAAAAAAAAVPTLVEAKFDFAPSNGTELRLVKGTRYQIVRRVDDNWYAGKDAAGATGIFPITYVEGVVDLGGELTRPSKRRRADDLTFSYTRQRTADLKAGAAAASRYLPTLPTRPTKPIDRLPYHLQRVADPVSGETRYFDSRANRTSVARPANTAEVSVVHIFDLDETLIQFNHLGTTFIPPRQLSSGKHGEAPPQPDRTVGKSLAKALEDLIFGLAASHFFFDDLEGCNQTDISALAHLDDRAPLNALELDADGFSWPKGPPPGLAHSAWIRLAHRLRAMADRYTRAAGKGSAGPGSHRPPLAESAVCSHITKHSYEKTTEKGLSFSASTPVDELQSSDGGWARVRIGGAEGWAPASYMRAVGPDEAFPALTPLGLSGVLSESHVATLADLHRDLAAYTEGWLDTALRLLHALQQVERCELVLVTNSELSAALTKCLIFRLGPFFRAENIYSSATVGKGAVFSRIQERFGKEPHYCAYGDGAEERKAADERRMAFRSVENLADLQRLCREAELNDGRVKT